MFSIGCLLFLDSYTFFGLLLDQMAKRYGYKSKIIYPFENYDLDTYNESIGNLTNKHKKK